MGEEVLLGGQPEPARAVEGVGLVQPGVHEVEELVTAHVQRITHCLEYRPKVMPQQPTEDCMQVVRRHLPVHVVPRLVGVVPFPKPGLQTQINNSRLISNTRPQASLV